MSLSHSQGLRDALHKLRDTYVPPTAEEVKLFSNSLNTEAQAESESVRLRAEMPVPMPDFKQQPKPAPTVSPQQAVKIHTLPANYPAEEVEPRW